MTERLAMARWVAKVLGWMPSPLHRVLDAWSQRRAVERRNRRLRLMVHRLAR